MKVSVLNASHTNPAEGTSAASVWKSPDEIPQLQRACVDVWQLSLNRPPANIERLQKSLSAGEVERSRRFLKEKDRKHYIVARAGLRRTLAGYLNVAPQDIGFGYHPHGKPCLDSRHGNTRLRFNLSHSGNKAVIGVTSESDVGIDIEYMRDNVDYTALAKRFFSPSEAAALLNLPPARLRQNFFRIWTRKEAYIKARGDGLSLPLDQFDVFAHPTHPPALLATRHDPPDKDRWSMAEIDCGKDYAGALAVSGKFTCLRLWRFGRDA